MRFSNLSLVVRLSVVSIGLCPLLALAQVTQGTLDIGQMANQAKLSVEPIGVLILGVVFVAAWVFFAKGGFAMHKAGTSSMGYGGASMGKAIVTTLAAGLFLLFINQSAGNFGKTFFGGAASPSKIEGNPDVTF